MGNNLESCCIVSKALMFDFVGIQRKSILAGDLNYGKKHWNHLDQYNYTNEETNAQDLKVNEYYREMHTKKEDEMISNESEKILFKAENIPKKVSIKDFKVKKDLGKGAFGKVCLVYMKSKPDQLFAMKILKKSEIFKKNLANKILLEKNILLKSKSNFLVKLFCAFQTPYKLYLIMEYVSGGDLYSLLNQNGFFSEEIVKFYICEIVMAIEYLHEGMGVIYRDLKPENILLTADGHIKITDFGLSKELILNEETYTFAGTPEYLAPEIIERKGHTKNVDWWSLGILIYEMLCGYSPFNVKAHKTQQKDNFYEIQRRIVKCEPTFPETMSENAQDLISKLLTKNYKLRLGHNLGAAAIKSHPFFEDVDWDAMKNLAVRPPISVSVLTTIQRDYSMVESKYIHHFPLINGFSHMEEDEHHQF